LLLNASAVILLHNHPGGDPEPTDADITATEEIKEALDMFEMNLLDHVIVSPHGCISMKRDGSLP
jgi:DNA repair protein RadC